jgi:hypothetical protein
MRTAFRSRCIGLIAAASTLLAQHATAADPAASTTPAVATTAAAAAVAATAASFDHSPWTMLLARHVKTLRGGQASQVDYAGFATDRTRLKTYLDGLARVPRATFDAWPRPARLAFLINAYNAWTVELILTKYPDLRSIRDLGTVLRSPWKRRFIPLLGQTLSLDDIEHDLIRAPGAYDEPRIHFAVNCASIGCPALRTEAFVAERLEAQLEDATRNFLADRNRNRLEGDALLLSSLFDWYRGDFERVWRGARSLPAFLLLYREALELTPGAAAKLAAGTLPIRHLEYDWDLNDRVGTR